MSRLPKLFVVVMSALLLAACSSFEEEKIVNVYNWSDYIDESLLTEFEQETGIKVVYDVFDSNDLLESKLLAGGTGYDVVVPTAGFLQREITAGVFQKLQKDKLPNQKHLWDVISKRVSRYDEGNQYSINYMWGTTGFGYVEEKIVERMSDAPVSSWRMIFDPVVLEKFADCGVHMLNAPEEMIPAVLNFLGEDPVSQDSALLEKAEKVLLSIRPYIKKFDSSGYINALANGDICLAVGWSGDIMQARDRAVEANNGVTINYVIPDEGALMWFDQMAIPADAPHLNNAHKFLDFIMRPEVIAKASNYIYYANGNKASQEFLSEDVIGDPAIYPSVTVIDRLYAIKTLGSAEQREILRLWSRVKSTN